ncbi:MAG: DUF2865 domain-containing protein [Hyphomicrobiaceae bacterium]
MSMILVRVRTFSRRCLASWFGMALVVVVAAVAAGIGLGRSITQPTGPVQVDAAIAQNAVLESSEWLSEGFWRKRRVRKLRARRDSGRDQLDANPFDTDADRSSRYYGYTARSGNYRTVCVRLCDGYYFPISASTNRGRFGIDEQACQSQCSSDARLFYYSNAGGSPETMRDRRGRAYADLKTAFSYRTVYDKSCRCRPDPWSEEAKQRHAMYTTKGWKKRARRLARLEKRRARRLAPRGIVQPAPAIVTSQSGQLNQGGLSDTAPAPYLRFAPLSNDTPVQRQRYSQVRMSLGRSAIRKRRQPRQRTYRRSRNKSWRSKIFNNTD